jgi:hypothetical protein
MAIIKDPKDPQGLMRALGPGAVGMSSSEENLIGDEPTFNDYENDDDTPASQNTKTNVNKRLDNVIKLVQEISQKSGLQKDEVYKVLSEISTSLQNNVQKTLTSAMDVINPAIKKDLIEVTRLLDTGSQSDQQLALKKLEDLQRKFNIDLKEYNKNLGKNLDKLNVAVNKMTQDREERILQAKEKQEEELTKGRATSISEDGNLKYLSKTEIVKKDIERKVIDKQIKIKETEFKKLLKEEGDLKRGGFSAAQQKKLKSTESEIGELKKQSSNITGEIGEKKPGFGAKAVGFLKGEEGPELIKEFMGTMYMGVESIIGTADKLLLNIPSKIGKKLLENGLTPLFDSLKKAGMMFSDKFKDFTKKTLEVLGKVFKPLTDKLKESLSGIGKTLMSSLGIGGAAGAGGGLGGLVGKGKGSMLGGIGRVLGMGAGLGGAGAAVGGTAAAGTAAAAGGSAVAGGGMLAALAPALPVLGLIAGVGAIGYGVKKLFDKKKEEGTLGSSYDESTGEYIPGSEEDNPEFYKNKKIMSNTESKDLTQLDYKKGINNNVDMLKNQSEKFASEGKGEPNNLAILNQSSPTTINRGESKTVSIPTYINSEPTFNIINVTRVS